MRVRCHAASMAAFSGCFVVSGPRMRDLIHNTTTEAKGKSREGAAPARNAEWFILSPPFV